MLTTRKCRSECPRTYTTQLFDISVDGEYFCSLRYSQLRSFHTQVRLLANLDFLPPCLKCKGV